MEIRGLAPEAWTVGAARAPSGYGFDPELFQDIVLVANWVTPVYVRLERDDV